MAQDNLARKFDPEDDESSQRGSSGGAQKPSDLPSSRLAGKEGNVLKGDFGKRQEPQGEQSQAPAESPQSRLQSKQGNVLNTDFGSRPGGPQEKGGKDDYYNNLNKNRQTDSLNKSPQQAQLGGQNKGNVAQLPGNKQMQSGGKGAPGGAGGKADMAKDVQKGMGDIKNAASDPNLSGRQKMDAAATAAVKTAGDTVARQYVSKQTGGTVDAKVGTIAADLKQKGLAAGVKSALVNVKILGVKLWIWIVAAIVIQIMIWVMMLTVIVATVAVACEATGVKIFGVAILQEGASFLTGIDIKGICEPLVSGLSQLGGSFGSNGGGKPSTGCNINEDLCKPETIKAEGDKYGCNWDPVAMSRICSHESNGVPKMSGTDRCDQQISDPEIRKYMREGYLSWSGGLWQIDIFTATKNRFSACAGLVEPKDTSYDGTPSGLIKSHGSCVPGHWKGNYCDLRKCGLKAGVTEAQYGACVRALFENIDEQYKLACEKFKDRGYATWPDSAKKCGVTS